MSGILAWAIGLLPIEVIEAVAGHLILRSARKRLRRGNGLDDIHEVRHLQAALLAGDSSDCDGGRHCALDRLP